MKTKLVHCRLLTLAFLSAVVLAQAALPTLSLMSNVGVFDFGRFNIGTASPSTVITFTNSGTTDSMTITGVSISGANAGDFAVAATTCSKATLAGGESCTATVNFTPLLIGPRSADLTVTDTADGSQHRVPLTGTGLDPALRNKNAGPVDPRIGYPLWYQDELGVQLTMCLDNSGFCVAPRKREKGELKDYSDKVEVEAGRTFAGFGFTLALHESARPAVKGEAIELNAVGFTPKPRVVTVKLSYHGVDRTPMSGRTLRGEHFMIQPEIPAVAKLFIKISDTHIWLTPPPSGFLRREGPLAEPSDQTVRVDLASGGTSGPAKPAN
jgi:hypothetical protein